MFTHIIAFNSYIIFFIPHLLEKLYNITKITELIGERVGISIKMISQLPFDSVLYYCSVPTLEKGPILMPSLPVGLPIHMKSIGWYSEEPKRKNKTKTRQMC